MRVSKLMALSAGSVLALGLSLMGPALAAEGGKKSSKPAMTQKGAAQTPYEEAVLLRDKALKGNIAYEFVEELTTRFGPRPAGSPSEQAAARWSAEKFKAMGFDKVTIEDVPLVHWVRGEEKVELVGDYARPISAVALGGAPATPAGGVEGEVVLFQTYQDLLDAPMGSLTGKIAAVLQPTPRAQDGAGYGATGMIRRSGPGEAQKRGAIGFVMRSLGTEDHRFAHTGSTPYLGDKAIPSFAVSPPDAEQLARLGKLGKPIRMKLFSTASTVQSHTQNVVAEITGREKPDEIIVIGGHLDSWDLGTGAIDDGAGVAITAAAGKLILDQPLRPKRTIRVVFFGAEEVSQPDGSGATGGNGYVKAHASELSKHIIAAESDFGAGNIYRLSLPGALKGHGVATQAARLVAPLKVMFDPSPALGGGVDVGPMNRLGVPTINLSQDGRDYFDAHHTADDTIERIDPVQMTQNVAVWAGVISLLANADLPDLRGAAAK